jgi:hypothetical protein
VLERTKSKNNRRSFGCVSRIARDFVQDDTGYVGDGVWLTHSCAMKLRMNGAPLWCWNERKAKAGPSLRLKNGLGMTAIPPFTQSAREGWGTRQRGYLGYPKEEGAVIQFSWGNEKEATTKATADPSTAFRALRETSLRMTTLWGWVM